MTKNSSIEILRADLREHAALKAWRETGQKQLNPQKIEILKEKKKSAVYRIVDIQFNNRAIIAKRCRKETALRERLMYEEVLPHLPLSRLQYYGFVETQNQTCWLFLEDAGSVEYNPRLSEHRSLAANWLGVLHALSPQIPAAKSLPQRDSNYYFKSLQCTKNSIERILLNSALQPHDKVVFEKVLLQISFLDFHREKIDEICLTMPKTIVHGDFVRKNTRIRNENSEMTIFPFDWETAGWGIPAADLCLFAGESFETNLSAYKSVINSVWKNIDFNKLKEWANVGMIVRLIKAMEWASENLTDDCLIWAPSKKFHDFQFAMDKAIQSMTWDN
jgi:hypothetical protein